MCVRFWRVSNLWGEIPRSPTEPQISCPVGSARGLSHTVYGRAVASSIIIIGVIATIGLARPNVLYSTYCRYCTCTVSLLLVLTYRLVHREGTLINKRDSTPGYLLPCEAKLRIRILCCSVIYCFLFIVYLFT